jgi:hypothetical protein
MPEEVQGFHRISAASPGVLEKLREAVCRTLRRDSPSELSLGPLARATIGAAPACWLKRSSGAMSAWAN